MSDKTLKRLVLGQMGLLAVLAAVLVWVIFPDGASFAWRGFYQPQNPATLEGGIQLPIAIRTEEARQRIPMPARTPIILEDFLIPNPTPVLPVIQPDSSGVGGWEEAIREQDRRREAIREQRADQKLPDPTPVRIAPWYARPESDYEKAQELQQLNRRIDCLERKTNGDSLILLGC